MTRAGFNARTIVQTPGNEACHVILHAARAQRPTTTRTTSSLGAARLASKGLPEAVMIDCSHGNSLKK